MEEPFHWLIILLVVLLASPPPQPTTLVFSCSCASVPSRNKKKK